MRIEAQVGELVEREAHAVSGHGTEQAETGRIEVAEDRLRHLDDEMTGVLAILVKDAGQGRQVRAELQVTELKLQETKMPPSFEARWRAIASACEDEEHPAWARSPAPPPYR